MHHYWPTVLHDAPGGALAQRSKLSNPEQFPPGPLRDYMEWLHQLWIQAAEPSSHELAEALKCSHTTVARLFKGLPSKKRRVNELLRYLYEHPRGRRVQRSEGELDAFYEQVDTRLKAAEQVAPVEESGLGDVDYRIEPGTAEFDTPGAAYWPWAYAGSGFHDRAPATGPLAALLAASRQPLCGFVYVYPARQMTTFDREKQMSGLRQGQLLPRVRRILTKMATVECAHVWQQLVVVDSTCVTGNAQVVHAEACDSVVVLIEGFTSARMSWKGIELALSREFGDGNSFSNIVDLCELLPVCKRALILLVNEVYENLSDDTVPVGARPLRGVLFEQPVDVIIAEVSPPEELGATLDLLTRRVEREENSAEGAFISEKLGECYGVQRLFRVAPSRPGRLL